MGDSQIIDLYWNRSENAIAETDRKYGKYCYSIVYNILTNNEDTKYKGIYGVMFTHEETQRIKQQPAGEEGEFLSAPMQTTVEIPWRYGENIWEVADVRRDITVTSIVLQPFSVKVSYEPLGQGWGWPNIYFDDGDLDNNDYIYACCILRDGSKITLCDWVNGGAGEEHYKLLEPDSPLVPEEVRCIQMPDGTKKYMDGTAEYPAKESQLFAAMNCWSVVTDTDVYAYYADFNADEAEDMQSGMMAHSGQWIF